MELVFEQDIYFSNKNHLPLTDIAKSLLALDKNAKAAPLILEKLYEDVVAQDIELFVERLSSGSLSEKIKYKLRLAIQDQIEDETGVALNLFSRQTQKKKEEILTWVIVAAILGGIKFATDKLSQSEAPNINQQVTINISEGHQITGIEPKKLNSAIESSLKETPGSVEGAVEFAKPAKRDPDASITINEQPFLSKDAVAEVPSFLTDTSQSEKSVELENTEIIIRATDRDSGKRGWGATFPAFSERRMKVTVAPGIDLNELAHKDLVYGNVTIFYSLDEKGNTSKQHAHIFSVELGR